MCDTTESPLSGEVAAKQTGWVQPSARSAVSARDPLPVDSKEFVSSFEKPGGKVYVLYGDALAFRISLLLAARIMHKGTPIAVIDGCNRFDVHLLSRFAQQRKLNPDQFLRRAFVSRGFTCYQMESAVTKLPAFLKKIQTFPLSKCLIPSSAGGGGAPSTRGRGLWQRGVSSQGEVSFILGLLDTFYDQQAPFREVRDILDRLLESFKKMRASGISLLLTSMDWKVIPEERNQLFASLKNSADKVFHLTLNESNQPKLFLEGFLSSNSPLTKGEERSGGGCSLLSNSVPSVAKKLSWAEPSPHLQT